jgi:hypothetical protein
MSKPSFVISCPFDTYSGYGARARDIAKAIIESDKYEVKLLNQRWGDTATGFCEESDKFKFLLDYKIDTMQQFGKQPDIWMQITIPNEFQAVGKYNIGCTAGIESTGCDVTWIEGLNRMNENWVSSEHSKKVFDGMRFEQRDRNTNAIMGTIKLEKPMSVVFEGVDLDVYKFLPNEEVNLDLSAIKESFCFLFVGHWMGGALGHDRKNVGLLVKYFFDTFKNKKNPPALILKASTGRDSYMSRESIVDRIFQIKSIYKGDTLPNVYVFNGNLSNEEVNELYNHPKVKAMISLTKGEGYGRPLAEFCLSKKPMIASGWSGHMDFLSPIFSTLIPGNLENVDASAANQWLKAETQWFQASTKHATNAMKEVHSNYKNFLEPAKRQSHQIKTNFSYDKMKELVIEILDKNVPEFATQVELVLPSLQTPKL